MSNRLSNSSDKSNISNLSSSRGSRKINPFSERILYILELSKQTLEQQQALSDKLEQDWKRLESFTPQFSAPFIANPNAYIDINDPEIMPEPDCPFDDNHEIYSALQSKYDSSGSDDDDDELYCSTNTFTVPFDIYDKVSYNNFNFHLWLKTFDLICIEEILVFHDLKSKEMWTKQKFDQIIKHPLIKENEKLISQINSMLIIFNSLKNRKETGKGVLESNNNNNNDKSTFIDQILKQHFTNPKSNIVPYNGLNYKLHKIPKMPPMPTNLPKMATMTRSSNEMTPISRSSIEITPIQMPINVPEMPPMPNLPLNSLEIPQLPSHLPSLPPTPLNLPEMPLMPVSSGEVSPLPTHFPQ